MLCLFLSNSTLPTRDHMATVPTTENSAHSGRAKYDSTNSKTNPPGANTSDTGDVTSHNMYSPAVEFPEVRTEKHPSTTNVNP